jgi:hypothetical protein
MTNQTVLPWIQTYTGKKFDFLNPDVDSVCIEDITHSLSNICRYTGHVKSFYSVAQHSVLVSLAVPEEDALSGLLHDAAEAYLTDISKPLKVLLPEYCRLEDNVWLKIAEKFNLPEILPASVKDADLRLLATEKRDLMSDCGSSWKITDGVECFKDKILTWGPDHAEFMFLKRFKELSGF